MARELGAGPEKVRLSLGTWVAIIGLGVMVMGNLGALVWGAATLSTAVNTQGEQLERVVRNNNQTAELLNQVELRVRILEDRVGELQGLHPRVPDGGGGS